jgi:hypothetical protein
MLTGKYTIVAFNSMGFPYSWDTNIISMTEEKGKVTVIHKIKRTKKAYKHTYDKDNELKIYNGWLGIDVSQNEMMQYDSNLLDNVKGELVYSL